MTLKQDIVARLLATENLTVVRTNADTASFDLVSRVLTLPIFKGMTPVIEDMMSCHEVGHAKWSPWKVLDEANKTPYLSGYWNVVEDARIEKLMKREYPGIRKTFTEAYHDLYTKGFFGAVFNKQLNLIDKINLFYKVGSELNLEFDDEEMEYVLKVAAVETEREALDVAREILAYEIGRGKASNRKGDMTADRPDKNGKKHAVDMGDELPEGEPEDADESDGPKNGRQAMAGQTESKSSDPYGGYIEAETQAVFTNKVKQSVDKTAEYKYWQAVAVYGSDPFIHWKRVMRETEALDKKVSMPLYQMRREKSLKAVNYLAKEFEQRKAAEAQKRVSISKTGMLATGQLYAYKLKDDIFKRHAVVPQGKNHGMIFLLDWSGSMDKTIDQCIRQAVDLAMFCRKCSIPFEVLAFTSSYVSPERTLGTANAKAKKVVPEQQQIAGKNGATPIPTNEGGFHILNLLSSEMSNVEFTKMASRLTTPGILTRHSGYMLGGTPLNEALIYMTRYIPWYRKRFNLEKVSFITMTDGEGHSLPGISDQNRVVSGGYKATRNFLRDPITKKDYPITGFSRTQTHALLKIIKDGFGVASIGFHIMESDYEAEDAVKTMIGKDVQPPEILRYSTEIRNHMRTTGVYDLPAETRDAMFIVKRSTLTEKEEEKTIVNENTSAAQAAKVLKDQLNLRKANRILLDKFIQTIA